VFFVNAIFRRRGTERLEAFSDGIFAFAVTLLVLNLYDPIARGSTSLLHRLLGEWPAFFAFTISFINILIMWMNHHNMFNYINRISREFMFLNGLLLLFVVLIPFTTLLVSEHLIDSQSNTAAAVYAGSFFIVGVVWNLLWHNATHFHNLISEDVPESCVKQIAREYSVAPIFFGIALVISLFSAIASLLVVVLVSIYYGITVTGGEQI
jgi:uncharacterized membrane protein